jgi:hypothetical protein
MAIAVGDRVRPRLSSSALAASRLNPQPPILGVVTRIVAGAPNLIFATIADNGITWSINASALSPNGVSESSLDQITAPDPTIRDAFIDKVVVGFRSAISDPLDLSEQYTSEYIGIVVDVYNVNAVATVLIKTQTGVFYELPITRVAILPFR